MKVALVTIALAVTTLAGPPASALSQDHKVPACEYEDSRNCVWDAKHMGNGSGRSFINVRGVIVFISHAKAHRIMEQGPAYAH